MFRMASPLKLLRDVIHISFSAELTVIKVSYSFSGLQKDEYDDVRVIMNMLNKKVYLCY